MVVTFFEEKFLFFLALQETMKHSSVKTDEYSCRTNEYKLNSSVNQ
jgi:hypothetical protein